MSLSGLGAHSTWLLLQALAPAVVGYTSGMLAVRTDTISNDTTTAAGISTDMIRTPSLETSISSLEIKTVTIFTSTMDPTAETLTGSIKSVPTSFLGDPVTRTLNNVRLFNGTCTQPQFAEVTDRAGQVLRYPQVGCASSAQECCPFPFQANVLLANCPLDYGTVVRGTYRACCPS